MEIQIKIVETGDSSLLANVAEDVFDHDLDTARVTDFLNQPNRILCIAVAEGLVVGQARAAILLQPDKAPELYIDNLGVASAFQRQGIATRLLEAIIQVARTHECTEIWVSTEPDNEPARAFYSALGLAHQTVSMYDGKL